MQRNEHTIDRIVRVILALVLGGLGMSAGLGSTTGVVLAVLAVILLVTGAVGFCPLYRLVGMSTCKTSK